HACQMMFGNRQDRRAYRDVLARAFDHGEMQDACKSFGGGTLPVHVVPALVSFAVPADIRVIAQTFCNAQEKRHHADYDLSRSFVRTDVLAFIEGVENAIGRLPPIRTAPTTKFFLICLLSWRTLKNRK
ncbi:MAG TPA: hypothetical protein VFI31_15255, partial [Pirellulales bacterium]|nr:hypothetical protein [Pirellulales bacterium]